MPLSKRLKGHGVQRRMLCALLVLAQLLSGVRVSAMPLQREEVDSLLGPGSVFSRDEVVTLLSNILEDADDEIGRTAEEAVKAAVVESSGEIAFQQSIAESRLSQIESLKAEAAKIDSSRGRWRKAALFEGFVLSGGILAAVLMK